MAKVVKVRYFTNDKKEKINKDNLAKYERYRKSNIQKNTEVRETTYKTYQNFFIQFLVYKKV